MKKGLYSLLAFIPLLIGGYFLFQSASANSEAMLTYLKDTHEYTIIFTDLLEQEASMMENGTEEEFFVFTKETLIPKLEEMQADSKAYGEGIEKKQLKDIHEIDVKAVEKYIEGQYAWLEGNYEEADAFFEEYDQLTGEYEEKLDKLAKKWAVEIEWE
ncbi:hypothetical protein JOC85_002515 [Bacillus mesophilus]|uniref:Uncharacterized protein n=1 Tax=Bacillus mesophilus TaxID=1808955 RepID=A0A6M0Q7Y1_9BACI|nr:hypothetical protein [Bacillus mesophilus]MBM7661712.1 hypothetical protein [Bacillus mesophilus]NEY72373.1 hypothetical protein [Bacillus mesophilus]